MLRCNDDNDRKAIAKAAGVSDTPATCIARVEDNILYGGFLFTNFTGKNGSIWGHVAGFKPMWLTKNLLQSVFKYAFLQCECRVVFTKIAATNTKSIDLCTKLGFNQFGLLPDVYPDGGGQLIFRMYHQECRWLPAKDHMSGTVH